VENKLPELRREHGLTQQQLADLVEVSRQTIISIEAGKFNPSVALAFKISYVFHRHIEGIFIYRGDEK
jgi:putative transcriptional regulator